MTVAVNHFAFSRCGDYISTMSTFIKSLLEKDDSEETASNLGKTL